ncbi:MAG: hypothetical protein PHQ55_10535, partial [Eubacteriales bacterium]|nr:hypothetical protein [Eubacteriales bacterium]MDD4683590.1 hypothetical protein [Eubacteriales bacterium]
MVKKTKAIVALIVSFCMMLTMVMPGGVLAESGMDGGGTDIATFQTIGASISVDENNDWVVQAENNEQLMSIVAISVLTNYYDDGSYYTIYNDETDSDSIYNGMSLNLDDNKLIVSDEADIRNYVNYDRGSYAVIVYLQGQVDPVLLSNELIITEELKPSPDIVGYYQEESDNPETNGDVYFTPDDTYEGLEAYLQSIYKIDLLHEDGSIAYPSVVFFPRDIYMPAQLIGTQMIPAGNYKISVESLGYKPVIFDFTLTRGYQDPGPISVEQLADGSLQINNADSAFLQSIDRISFENMDNQESFYCSDISDIIETNIIKYDGDFRKADFFDGSYLLNIYAGLFGNVFLENIQLTKPSPEPVADIGLTVTYDEDYRSFHLEADNTSYLQCINGATLTDASNNTYQIGNPTYNDGIVLFSDLVYAKVPDGSYKLTLHAISYEDYTFAESFEVTNGYVAPPGELICTENEEGSLIVSFAGVVDESAAQDFFADCYYAYLSNLGDTTINLNSLEMTTDGLLIHYDTFRDQLTEKGEYNLGIHSHHSGFFSLPITITKDLTNTQVSLDYTVDFDDGRIYLSSDNDR